MIQIIDNFLDISNSLDELYQYFYYAGQWQFDFMPAKYINKDSQSTKVETQIAHIIRKICEKEPKFVGAGYEVWVNLLDANNNHLDQHIDCEEAAKEMVPAKMTATIYIGNGEGMEGGELALHTVDYTPDTQFFPTIYEVQKAVNENVENNWIKIPYKYNRLLLFDSQYSHAVLPITKINQGEARITLTISSWDKKIKVIR